MAGPRDNNVYRNQVMQSSNYGNGGSYNRVPIKVATPESAITYEGIFNEYNFSNKIEEEHLFATDYSRAISKNVETGEKEYFICLEMMSKLDGDGLQKHGGRPPMNFSFVLDISGSMNSPFDGGKTKLDIAKECLINLMSRLKPKDQFGIILFDDRAECLIPLNSIARHDLAQVKTKLLDVRVRGGTSVLAGLQAAEAMLKKSASPDNKNLNRIIFLTDLMPSSHEEADLLGFAQKASADGMFLSVIGIGLDFNSNLSYQLAKVRGCNSFGVLSAAQFRKQMIEEFDHMCLMIVFDVSLKMQSSVFEVVEIYGSPATPNKEAGEVLKIESVCPSNDSSEGIKGGVALLKLKRKNPEVTTGDDISLRLSYVDWDNKAHNKDSTYKFIDDSESEEYYENNTVRKAVALMRYVTLVKKVLREPSNTGNKDTLEKCRKYLTSEIEVLNDRSMEKEIEMIESHLKNIDNK